MEKICTTCHISKPLEAFTKRGNGTKLRASCKECQNQKERLRLTNPVYRKERNRKARLNAAKKDVKLKRLAYLKARNQTIHGRYIRCKHDSAISRHLTFSLTEKEYEQIVTQPCYYCNNHSNPYNGIDRIDNTKGYSIDNGVPCCTVCNYMKRDYTVEFFLQHVQAIVNKRSAQYTCAHEPVPASLR